MLYEGIVSTTTTTTTTTMTTTATKSTNTNICLESLRCAAKSMSHDVADLETILKACTCRVLLEYSQYRTQTSLTPNNRYNILGLQYQHHLSSLETISARE
jgi:hypothetical protein